SHVYTSLPRAQGKNAAKAMSTGRQSGHPLLTTTTGRLKMLTKPITPMRTPLFSVMLQTNTHTHTHTTARTAATVYRSAAARAYNSSTTARGEECESGRNEGN